LKQSFVTSGTANKRNLQTTHWQRFSENGWKNRGLWSMRMGKM